MIQAPTILPMLPLVNPLPWLEFGEGDKEVLLGELPRSRLVVGETGMLDDGDSVA